MSKLLKMLLVIVCVIGGLMIGSRIHIKIFGVYEIQDILWFLATAVFFTWLAWKHLFPIIDKEFPPESNE